MHSPSRARLPKLSAILAFETAARTGSLARAADTLALTAAAVSQQIRQLEQHLGITLFIRAKSGVTLTEQGADYLAYVQEAFETLRVAQQHVERQRGKQALTVFALPALASKWLNPALGDWLAQCPDGDLRLHATHAAVDFAHSAADFALCFGDQDYPLLEKMQLFQDRVQPVCSPALRDRGDWTQLPLIHVDWGKESQFLPGWHEWFTAADRSPPATIAGRPYFMPKNVPLRQVAITSCQSSTAYRSMFTSCGPVIPALLTSRCSAPQRRTVSSMPCCTDGASRTSIRNVITRRPSGSSRAAAAARGAAWRPVITTVAPRRNSSAAIASPMPVEAPVTSATRCLKSCIAVLLQR